MSDCDGSDLIIFVTKYITYMMALIPVHRKKGNIYGKEEVK